MSSLTIEQKIGQLFFIGIPGSTIDDGTRSLLEEIQPGGICLFARNIRERAQTRDLVDVLRASLPAEPLLSIDQEGGLVDRLRRVLTPMPAAEKIRDVEDAIELARIIARALRMFGLNMNFAPVADVVTPDRGQFSNGLHSRAFGRSKDEATKLASAFLETMQHGGVVGCLKHFPGLGASEVDSHKELPRVAISEEELRDVDLYPYRVLFGEGDVKAVMVAHAAFPNVGLQEHDQRGKLLPSSLSPAIISKLLRGELGFEGLVLTDDLEMGAIVENYGIGEACVMAIDAGIDMLAICASSEAIREGHNAVADSVRSGRISEDRIDRSIERISSLRTSLQEPLPFDTDELDALSNDIANLNARLE